MEADKRAIKISGGTLMVFWIDIGFCLLTQLGSLFRLSHLNNDKGGDKKTDYDHYRRTHYRIEYRR